MNPVGAKRPQRSLFGDFSTRLFLRGDLAQNRDEIVIRVYATELPIARQFNGGNIKTHLRVNPPSLDFGNVQPVICTPTSAGHNLGLLELHKRRSSECDRATTESLQK